MTPNRWWVVLLLSVVIAGCLSVFACRGTEPIVQGHPEEGFRHVFSGFIYVGRDVDPESHGRGTEMPPKVESEHAYIFHHAASFNEGACAE